MCLKFITQFPNYKTSLHRYHCNRNLKDSYNFLILQMEKLMQAENYHYLLIVRKRHKTTTMSLYLILFLCILYCNFKYCSSRPRGTQPCLFFRAIHTNNLMITFHFPQCIVTLLICSFMSLAMFLSIFMLSFISSSHLYFQL